MADPTKSQWVQSIMTASATFAMIVGGVTIWYLVDPPPEPPPLCLEYRLRETGLTSSLDRFAAEKRSLEELRKKLVIDHEAIERVNTRYSELRRWEALMSLAAGLREGLERAHANILAEFGEEDRDFTRSVLPAERKAWDNLLSDAGWPPRGRPRDTLKYWLDDYTDVELDHAVFSSGPTNRTDIERWREFLSEVESTAYYNYDRMISDIRTLPDALGPVPEVLQRSSRYDTRIATDVLERLRARRVSVEDRQYQVERDIFKVENELHNIEAERERVNSLAEIAECVGSMVSNLPALMD